MSDPSDTCVISGCGANEKSAGTIGRELAGQTLVGWLWQSPLVRPSRSAARFHEAVRVESSGSAADVVSNVKAALSSVSSDPAAGPPGHGVPRGSPASSGTMPKFLRHGGRTFASGMRSVTNFGRRSAKKGHTQKIWAHVCVPLSQKGHRLDAESPRLKVDCKVIRAPAWSEDSTASLVIQRSARYLCAEGQRKNSRDLSWAW